MSASEPQMNETDIFFEWFRDYLLEKKINPKTAYESRALRKFMTTWLLTHGMLPDYVNILTGHTPASIITRHYLDMSRIKQEYEKATINLKLL